MLQSVMTVFRPKKPDEPWGIKFWSDQLVRYACYELEDGTFVGDLANKGLTKYLIEKKLWVPPVPRTQHDVLPVVFKMPNRDQPFVHQFDKKFVDEADIFHPKYPKVAKLHHKWASVPAINVFNMNLGGVDYGCTPFNGWFCSVEIVRDLMERYQGASEKWAAAIGINPKTHRMWKARVAHEMDVAILHSFDKAGYTIVDPETVGEQFMTHCKRERDSGRECPAQWSWIGGLTGPINKTWHKVCKKSTADFGEAELGVSSLCCSGLLIFSILQLTQLMIDCSVYHFPAFSGNAGLSQGTPVRVLCRAVGSLWVR